jgi:hypothetical protein
MRRPLLLLACGLLALGFMPKLGAQTTQNFGVPILSGPTVPGSCTVPSLFINNATGDAYGCKAGVFVLLGGGGVSSFNTRIGAVVPATNDYNFNQLAGTASDAQLAGAYSGVGACATNQFASTLTRNAAPTCAFPFSSLTQDASGNLTSANSFYVKGVTPWVDVHAYGSRGVIAAASTPGVVTTTGTMTVGSPNLTLGADLNWAANDGIVVPGAGAAVTLAAPAYLAVAICTRTGSGVTPFYDNSASCTYSPAAQYSSFSYTWKVAVKDTAGGQTTTTNITANGPPVITEGLGRSNFVPVPGSGLTLNIGTLGFSNQYAFCSQNSAWVNYGQQASITLTASSTNYVYLNASTANCPITANTTGYPANNLYYAIARVTTGTAAIGNILDDRVDVWPVVYAPPVTGAEAYEVYRGNVGIAETWGVAGAANWAPLWASGSYTQGQVVMPTTLNGHLYMDVTAGTNASGGSQPTWCTAKDCQVTDGGITWQEMAQDSMAFGDVGAPGTICDTCAVGGANDWLQTTVQTVTDTTHLVLVANATTAVTAQAGVRHDDTAAFNAACLAAAQAGGNVSGGIQLQSGTCYARGNFWVSGLDFPATTPNSAVGVTLKIDGLLRTSRRLKMPYQGTVIEGLGGAVRPSFAKNPVAAIVGQVTPLIQDAAGTTLLRNLYLECGNECILNQANYLQLDRVATNDAYSNSDPLPLIEFYGSYGHIIQNSTLQGSSQTNVAALYFTRRLSDANGSGITRITNTYLVSGNILLVPSGASSNMGEIYGEGIITENLLPPVVQCDILASTVCQGITINNTSVNDSGESAQATVGGAVLVGTIGTGAGYISGVTITNGGANQLLDCSATGSIKNANIQVGINTGSSTTDSRCGTSFTSTQNQHTIDALTIGSDFGSPAFPLAPSPLGCTFSTTTATCTSTKPMTIKTGDNIYVSGVTDTGYNGLAANVTMVGTAPYYQVQFTPAGTPAGASGGGTIQLRNLKQLVMDTGANGNTLKMLASNLTTKLWGLHESGLMDIADPLSANFINFQGAPLTATRTYTLPDASGTLPEISGAITTNDCAKWASATQLSDAGACGGASLTVWANPPNQAGASQAVSAQNAINISPMYIPFSVTFGHIAVDVGTADGTNNSDFGIYDSSGNLKCNIGAAVYASTGVKNLACTQGSVTISPGIYFFAFTTNGSVPTLKIYYSTASSGMFTWWSQTSATASTGGALPGSINVGLSGSPTLATTYVNPFIILH